MVSPEFLIYRSSAGSGKTQALAKEYLKLVLGRKVPFRNVLAITFTNKAAEEMKERVLNLLRLFAAGIPEASYHRKLLEEISLAGNISSDEVCSRAEELHREILHHYTDFSIGTIDSFVHRIIRSFALELNLSYTFEVQLETGDFVKMAIDDLLEHTGEDRELTRTLVQYTRLLLEDEKSWHLDAELASFAGFLTGENSVAPLEKLASVKVDLAQVAIQNRRAIHETLQSWDTLASKAHNLVVECGVGPEYFSFGLSGGIFTFFEGLLQNHDYDKVFHRAEKLSRIRGYLDEGKPFVNKQAPADVVATLKHLSDALIPLWEELCMTVDAHYPLFAARTLLQKNLTWLSLSRKIRHQMQVTMNRENLIPIYEFNRLIWNIIRHQPVPFIYERTSDRYDHYLIDEFQDTSSMQWHNLLPLIEDSLSRGGISMVVGDAKQAIYRWRNGDVWQFVRLPEVEAPEGSVLLQERAAALKRYAKPKFLDENYRSTASVIDFNNAFFEWIKGKFPVELGEVFDRHSQKPGINRGKGLVEIAMVTGENGQKAADIEQLVLNKTVETVQSVLGTPGSRFSPSDLCILVRRNREAGSVASALVDAGIPVVSAESFPLKGFPEPVFFRAITGLLLNRSDRVQGAVIATRLFHMGRIADMEYQNALSSLRPEFNTDGGLWIWAGTLFNRCGIHRTMEQYHALPVYELCEQVIRDFFGSEASPSAVHHLLDLTAAFVRRYGNDLATYVQHLDKALGSSVPLPETGQAVRIMTIHKSKGLQFPVVIYPFANEGTAPPPGSRQLLWVDGANPDDFFGLPALLLEATKELADTPFAPVWKRELSARLQDVANLAYVAFTRAADRLYVISAPPSLRSSGSDNLNRMLTDFLGDTCLLTQTDANTWRYGEAEDEHFEQIKTPVAAAVVRPWSSYDWTNRISISTNHLRFMEDHPHFEALNRGILIHNILAQLPSVAELPVVLDAFETSGLLGVGEKESLLDELQNLLQNPSVAHFFQPENQHRREATLLNPDGKQLRPDRVVQLSDYLAVLDYKTGEPQTSHRQQVATYCDMLRRMGNAAVKGYLLYTTTGILEEI